MTYIITLFVLIPFTIILLLIWVLTKNNLFANLVLASWSLVLGIYILIHIYHFFTDKIVLDKEDFYGSYIVNRTYFPGKQSDWQYDHFRFEIKQNDSIYFYVTENEKTLRTYKGSIHSPLGYKSKRLHIVMDQPTHHIMAEDPSIYRSTWGFYLVFHSSKFNNVFFKKGDWEEL